MLKICAVMAATLLAASPAWAINKCTGPDGKVVFQDAPCADGRGGKIDVKPASGFGSDVTSSSPGASSAAAPARASMNKEGVFGESWQRRTFLENRGVAEAKAALRNHLQRCEAKQRELAARKNSANNNLAGATWEQSISMEMQATATMCDSQTRELRIQVDALEKELRELQSKQ